MFEKAVFEHSSAVTKFIECTLVIELLPMFLLVPSRNQIHMGIHV